MKSLCLQILGFSCLLLINPIKCRVIDNGATDTTVLPTELPTTPPSYQEGCFHEGSWYPFDSEISSGKDEEVGWCYGLLCDRYGGLVHWDNFNCYPSTTTTNPTTTPTTTDPTTAPMTTPPHWGCFYEQEWYAPYAEISRGTDGHGWCFGLYCDADGYVVAWDDWNCGPSTTGSTASPPETTPPPAVNTEISTTHVVTPETTPPPAVNTEISTTHVVTPETTSPPAVDTDIPTTHVVTPETTSPPAVNTEIPTTHVVTLDISSE